MLDLKDIYTGQLVKSNKHEGALEVIRIDDFSYSVWVRPLNSIDFELIEVQISDLREARRV